MAHPRIMGGGVEPPDRDTDYDSDAYRLWAIHNILDHWPWNPWDHGALLNAVRGHLAWLLDKLEGHSDSTGHN